MILKREQSAPANEYIYIETKNKALVNFIFPYFLFRSLKGFAIEYALIS